MNLTPLGSLPIHAPARMASGPVALAMAPEPLIEDTFLGAISDSGDVTPTTPPAPIADSLPPPPVLRRPVLFVHGYNGGAYVFETMNTYLHGDGINAVGGTLQGTQPPALDPDGKLFKLDFSKPWQSAARNADELEQALEAIARATGHEKIDVVAHSMGGLDTRLYIDRGGRRVGRLFMMAPPNHGSIQANAELWMREHLGIPVFPPNSDPDVMAALRDLRVDQPPEENDGIIGNPFLHDLNSRWFAQKAATEGVRIFVGGGVPTLEPDGTMTVQGDGFVPWSSSAMPGVRLEPYIDPVKNTHGRMLRDPRVMVDVGQALA